MKTEITVEQAFKFILSLWPEVDRIRPSKHTSVVKLYVLNAGHEECLRNLDLGVGITWNKEEVYPVPEKKWRPAEFPRDWNRLARFRSDGGNWYEGTLVGYDPYFGKCFWIRSQHNIINRWEKCEVLITE